MDRISSTTRIGSREIKKEVLDESTFTPNVFHCKLSATLFDNIISFPSTTTKAGIAETVLDDFLKERLKLETEESSRVESTRMSSFDTIYTMILKVVGTNHWSKFTASEFCIQYVQYRSLSQRKLEEKDFHVFRILGRGGFGMVSGCQVLHTGKVYAMKQMNKKRVKAKGAEDICLLERKVLHKIDVHNKFVLSLKYAFQSTEELFLILDVCTGGDLDYHLRQNELFKEDRARFYAAQVLLGLEHLHR